MAEAVPAEQSEDYLRGLVHAYEKLHRLGVINYSAPEKVYFVRYENGAVMYLQYVDRDLYVDSDEEL